MLVLPGLCGEYVSPWAAWQQSILQLLPMPVLPLPETGKGRRHSTGVELCCDGSRAAKVMN